MPDLNYSDLIVACVFGDPGAELDADAILATVEERLQQEIHR